VGRIGCRVAGDGDWGTVTDAVGVAYTKAIMAGGPLNRHPARVRVHPTPIYEFIESLIIFGILWSLKRRLSAGTMFWLC
jgi:phosphatidylglycerol:prolipoprotein diacylglycerol transferase